MANQTHRAIIFEEFDDSRNDLFTILNNDPSNDRLAADIENKLLVHSFNEFMEKFAPKIYEVAWRDESGNIQFSYTTDRNKFPNCPYVTLDIDDHAFYKMLWELYTTRGKMGQSNLKFDDNEIMEMLTPKKELEEARDLRKKMDFNMKLFYEAKACGNKSEMNVARSKLADGMDKISEYSSSPLNKLLPLIIEDLNKKLELFGKTTDDNGDGTIKALPSYGQLYLNGAGQLDILDAKKDSELKALPAADQKGGSLVVVGDNHPAQITTLPAKPAQNKVESPVPDEQTLQNKIAKSIVEDYDENPNIKIRNEQIKNLIVSTFAPLAVSQKNDVAHLDREKLLVQLKIFENAYASARQSFANEMARIVESLLGVKTFFDHATVDGGESSEISEGVIIANCKASRLLSIAEKFTSYMKYLGKDQGESRIWFAVLPSVFENPPTVNVVEDDDDDDPLSRRRRTKNTAPKSESYVSVNSLKKFIKIMDDAKILTVFNIRVDKGNTFADLTAAEVQNKMTTFKDCDYAHAVYAYPNFTLILERNLKPFDNNVKITLPSMFVDAAYPAAGLLVASQQPKILSNRKLNFDKDSPCVSVDFENLQVKKKLPTKFNRESVLRRSEDLIKAINEKMFGFAFSGDEVEDESGVWKNSYVHCARTLAKMKKGDYKPVYQTLTEDYIAQRFLRLTSKKKSDVEKLLIKKINNECEEKNGQNRYKDSVNLLLRTGEYLYLGEKDGKDTIFVHFVGGDSDIDAPVESD